VGPTGARPPEAGELTATDWDRLFDELYLRTYAALADPETARKQAEGLVRLVGLELDADVSTARAGEGEWPRFVQADYRELPFEDGSFDCVANLFSSLGFWGEEGDRRAIAEFRRVLRPGGSLVVETMHRDLLMTIFGPKSWERLPDGALMIEERAFDHERGVIRVRHEVVEPDGARVAAPYELRVYTATELIAFARDVGFEHVSCHGDLDGAPLSRDTRLVLVAR